MRHFWANVYLFAVATLFLASCATEDTATLKARAELRDHLLPYDASSFIKQASEGKLDNVKMYLSAGMEPDVYIAGTALVAAAANGHADICRLLLEHDADEDARSYTHTALMSACQNDHYDVAKLLIEWKADVNARTVAGTALTLAAARGHCEIIDLLVKNKAKINKATRPREWTPLMFAAVYGQSDAIETLADLGADLNQKDMYGKTALDLASEYGQDGVLTTLLEKGADASNKPEWWRLLASGKDVNEAMRAAIARGDSNAIRQLVARGADPNGEAFDTMPLLLWAIYNNFFDGAKTLLECGANPNVTGRDGMTAFDYAIQQRDFDLAKVLRPDLSKKIEALAKTETKRLKYEIEEPPTEKAGVATDYDFDLTGQASTDTASVDQTVSAQVTAAEAVAAPTQGTYLDTAKAATTAKPAKEHSGPLVPSVPGKTKQTFRLNSPQVGIDQIGSKDLKADREKLDSFLKHSKDEKLRKIETLPDPNKQLPPPEKGASAKPAEKKPAKPAIQTPSSKSTIDAAEESDEELLRRILKETNTGDVNDLKGLTPKGNQTPSQEARNDQLLLEQIMKSTGADTSADNIK